MIVISFDQKYLPTKWTPESLCWDLKAWESVKIKPGEIKLVRLWIKTDFTWKLYARSSLPLKKWLILANSVGIIDKDYRQEVKAMLWNITDKEVEIKDWERICQMEIYWEFMPKPSMLVDEDLFDNWEKENPTERKWGFGSTWK